MKLIERVSGDDKIPKNGEIEFPTLTRGMPFNDNGPVSHDVEGVSAHGKSGGTIHDSGAFS